MTPRARRRLRRAAWSLLAAFVLLNVLAYRHARALTVWTAGGPRTGRPETLSALDKLAVLVAGPRIPRPRNRRSPADLGLAYELHLFPGRDGIELEAWLVPHPDAAALVLMFHGYADSKDSLLVHAQAVHRLGLAALLVDFRGSGGSSGHETSIGFHEAADVTAAFAYARGLAGDRPLVLFGASMGAAAVLRSLAVDRLAPAAVVLESPFDTLRHTIGNRFALLGVPSFPGADLLVLWGGLLHGFNGFRHNPVDYATRVHVPVLILHGERDERAHLDEARRVLDRLGGPKRLVVFPRLGHGGLVAAQPGRWRDALAGFLGELGIEARHPEAAAAP